MYLRERERSVRQEEVVSSSEVWTIQLGRPASTEAPHHYHHHLAARYTHTLPACLPGTPPQPSIPALSHFQTFTSTSPSSLIPVLFSSFHHSPASHASHHNSLMSSPDLIAHTSDLTCSSPGPLYFDQTLFCSSPTLYASPHLSQPTSLAPSPT